MKEQQQRKSHHINSFCSHEYFSIAHLHDFLFCKIQFHSMNICLLDYICEGHEIPIVCLFDFYCVNICGKAVGMKKNVQIHTRS